MNEELLAWLNNNKIQYHVIDNEVFEIEDFGKVFYEDTDSLHSIFRIDENEEVKFNSMESTSSLMKEDINYIAFKFGDNFYYYDLREEFEFNILKYVGKTPSLKHSREFVNLGIHSQFELLNGSFSIGDWIKKAKYLGESGIGVCDYNTMASHLILQKECKKSGVTPIFGYSLIFTDGENKVGAKIYVQSQDGLQNLLRIQKAINVDSQDKTIDIQDLLKYGPGNVIVFDKYSSYWLKSLGENIDLFYDKFIDCFYQLDLTEYKSERIDIKVLEATKYYFDNEDIDVSPILITDCYYLDKDDSRNKVILNKIASGASHEQSLGQYFKDLDEQYDLLDGLFDHSKHDVNSIFEMACDNTVSILNGAKASFDTEHNFMPAYDMTPEEIEKYGDQHSMFLQLLDDGFKKLVPKGKEEIYKKRLDYEIYVLESTNNLDYMLVQYDTVNWARANDILVGSGRGSAGGCLVLYLLGITLIDPIKYDLIFERFLLPERAGLYPSKTTIVGEDIEVKEYTEVTLSNNKKYKIANDAILLVNRDGVEEPLEIEASELKEDDDILFDNRDVLFTLNEI